MSRVEEVILADGWAHLAITLTSSKYSSNRSTSNSNNVVPRESNPSMVARVVMVWVGDRLPGRECMMMFRNQMLVMEMEEVVVEIGVTSRVVVVVATEAQHRLRVDLSALLLPMLRLDQRMRGSQVRIIVVVGEVLADIGVIIHMLGVKDLGGGWKRHC
jgi:hypothetical protein